MIVALENVFGAYLGIAKRSRMSRVPRSFYPSHKSS